MATNFDRILDSFVGPKTFSDYNPKIAEVDATSQTKQAQVADQSQAIKNAVFTANHGGVGFQSADGLEADLNSLDPLAFALKYGDAALPIFRQKLAEQNDQARVASASERNPLQVIGDFANSALTAGVGGLAGIGATGVGLVNNRLGAKAASLIQSATEGMQSLQSEQMQKAREDYSGEMALRQRDRNAEDTSYVSNGPLIDGLRSFGLDAIDSVKSIASNPLMAEDTVASGVGSLLTAGPLGKGLAKAGELALETAVKRGGLNAAGRAAEVLDKAIPKITTPVSIGLQEGGGAYQQTAAQALQQLQNRTDLTEDQKYEYANKAGLLAAAVQGPAAAIVSKVTGGAEIAEHPFKASGLVEGLRHVGQETLDETIQSGIGQVAQNLGIQKYVDPNQSLTEGAGEQAVLGGIGGFGSAGMAQAPRSILHTALAPVRAITNRTVPATSGVGTGVGRGAQDINPAATPASAPVSNEQAQTINDAVHQDLPVAEPVIRDAIETSEQTPEDKAASHEAVSRLVDSFRLQPDELGSAPDHVQSVVNDASDRLTALQRVAQAYEQEKDPDKKMDLANAAWNLQQPFSDLIHQDADIFSKIPANHPAGQYIDDFISARNIIGSTEDFQKMSESADKLIQTSAQVDRINNAENPDPIALSRLAQVAPDKVSPEAVQTALLHSEQGLTTLSDQQKAALQSASSLVQAQRDADAKATELSLTQKVSDDIQTATDSKDAPGFSVKEHVTNILAAMAQGDIPTATKQLQNMINFAQHMNNKVDALNRHYDDPRTAQRENFLTDFAGFTPKGKPYTAKTFLNPRANASIALAQRVNVDAQHVTEVANRLTKIFPQLGIKPVEAIDLHNDLFSKPASEVVKEQKEKLNEQTKANPIEQTESTPVPEEAPTGTSEEEAPREEAQPKEEDKAPVEEAKPFEPVKADTKSMFGKLQDFTGKVGNLFKSAFLVPEKSKSRLLNSARLSGVTPQEFIENALSSREAFIENADLTEEETKGYTADVAKAYEALLTHIPTLMDRMQKSLDAQLSKVTTKGKNEGKTYAEVIADGFAHRYASNKALNITEEVDGKIIYNQHLLASAVLAGLQFALTGKQFSPLLDDERIAKLLGVNENQIQDSWRDALTEGMTTASAKSTLAQKITSYWGLKANNKGLISSIEGIPEAIAAELIKAMVEEGLLTKTNLVISADNKPDVYGFLSKSDETIKDGKKLPAGKLNAFKKFQSAIDLAILTEPEKPHYVDQAPKQVGKTQLRTNTPLTEQQTTVQEKNQNIPYFANKMMINLYEAIGLSGLQQIFGGGFTEGQALNKNHRASLEGQNTTIRSAFQSLFDNILPQIQQASETNGVDLSEVKNFYRFQMNRLNRLQMIGENNPQASKLMREAILATRTTLDLTNADDRRSWDLALAQALGIKVHTQSYEVSKLALDKLLTSSKDVIDILGQHQETGAKLKMDEIQKLTDFSKANDMSFAGLHALMDYARFQLHEDPSKFVSQLYVEADGVTNGPINAMMLMASGDFTPTWVNNIAKGGLFFEPNKTMNDHRSSQEGRNDLYQATTDRLKQLLANRQYRNADSELLAKAMHPMMLYLFDGYDIKDGNLEISRGVSKNPLTITIYGSSSIGIASKIASTMMDAFYEKLSDAAQQIEKNKNLTLAEALFPEDPSKLKGFQNALSLLTSFHMQYDRETRTFHRVLSDDLAKKNWTERKFNIDPEKFTMPKEAMETFSMNVRDAFVRSLSQAINDTVGQETMVTSEVVRNIINTQTQTAIKYRADLIRDLLDEKTKGLDEEEAKLVRNHDWLTQEELDTIDKKVREFSPLVRTGNQNIQMFKDGPKSELGISFGNGFNDTLNTNGNVNTPAPSGVSGSPKLVIGMGDGQMIQNFGMDPRSGEYTPIFDGIHLALNNLTDGGLAANQAVADSWKGNPIKAVYESFAQFAENYAKQYPEEHEVIRGNEANLATLQRLAVEVEARHRAIQQVQFSLDQMAATFAPFQNESETSLQGLDNEQISQRLNELKNALLPEIQKEFGIKPDKIVNADFEYEKQKKTFEDFGRVDKESGARIFKFTTLKNILKGLPLEQKLHGVLQDILRSQATKGYTIIAGNTEQILAYANRMGDTLTDRELGANGFILPGTNRIYVRSLNSEVLVHELVHAATMDHVNDFYSGNTVASHVSEAITRMEALMQQYIAEASEGDQVRQLLEQNLALNQKAEALNEFMAWGLTNQNTANKLSATKANSLGSIVKNLIDAMKKLIFGRKLVTKPGLDMFSNLRFNANVLFRAQPSPVDIIQQSPLLHANFTPATSRLQQVLENAVIDYIGPQGTNHYAQRKFEHSAGQALSVKAVDRVANAGWVQTNQEKALFSTIVEALATQAQLDPNSLAAMQETYVHTVNSITPDTFRVDPTSNDPADIDQANKKYNLVVSKYGFGKDVNKRDTYLSMFLALAMTNDDFRNKLTDIGLPKGTKDKSGTLDAFLTNLGNGMMDRLARSMSGQGGKAKNVREAMDALTAHIIQQAEAQANIAEASVDKMESMITGLNNWMVRTGTEAADKAFNKAAATLRNPNIGKTEKAIAHTIQMVTALVSETNSNKVAEGLLSGLNKMNLWDGAYQMMVDIIGRIDSNKDVADLMKQVRSFVSQIRQRYREHLPTVIASKFTRALTDQEWSDMHTGLGKTDLASLVQSMGINEVMKLLEDSRLVDNHINTISDQLQTEVNDPNLYGEYTTKMDQLANFMNTGVYGANFLGNAHAIAHLFNSGRVGIRPSARTINLIDQLVSLKAFKNLGDETKQSLSSLAQSEAEGMKFSLNYLVGQNEEEQRKILMSPRARNNAYKGYIPTELDNNQSLVVEIDGSENANKLLRMGYERTGDYNNGVETEPRGYYYLPITSRARYSQGALQNVRTTANGVDVNNGFTQFGNRAGTIIDSRDVNQYNKTAHTVTSNEHLRPVFNENGKVVAFERTMDPEQTKKLQSDNHFAKMIGQWRGRQAEELHAEDFNDALIQKLYKMWHDDSRAGRADEYVNIFDPTQVGDVVRDDATNIFTPQSRRKMIQMFKTSRDDPAKFMVRKDMLDAAFGYRQASIGDLWTGNSRWSPSTQKAVRDIITKVLGPKAYIRAVRGEQFVQGVVQDARQAIVVKSVIVPVSNLISNVYQLIARGVPLKSIIGGMPRKTAEIEAYVKSNLRKITLEAELRAETNPMKIRSLEAEINSIEDSHKRLSIYPLISAGEFSGISDHAGPEDVSLASGKLNEYIEGLIHKLPENVRTAGRYAYITRDTAFFQGLQKSVEYGDFLAKAILYDDLTQRLGKDHEYAHGRVTEEFVNYDRLPGRFRGYLESVGLLWFWNFKLRSAKIAVSMLRNNPLHALIAASAPVPPIGVGLPLTDNLFGVFAQGNLGYSIGPSMGFHGITMNPWYNLATS